MTIYPSSDLTTSSDEVQDLIYDFGPLSLQYACETPPIELIT